MVDDLLAVKAEFNDFFKERSDEVNCALLAILSGEHVLFLGPPGTAKSLLSKCICEAVEGADFYYYLLTKYTTPEEIYGPLSLKSLKEDEFKRKTDGYLPSASIAFLDEIFKANSSILNSLLTILNERQFHNGMNVMKVPLLSVFGASNELPEDGESLGALYDRFLFRCMVDYIQDDTNFRQLVFSNRREFDPKKKLSMMYIKSMKSRINDVKVDDDVERIILELRRDFMRRGIPISDRRWLKIVDVLKVAAASIGEDHVDRTMILLLKHMLWDKPDQRDALRNLLIDLVATAGINLDKLDTDLNELQPALKSMGGNLPFEVYCVNCKKNFYDLDDLVAHSNRYPSHKYLDPSSHNSDTCHIKPLLRLISDQQAKRDLPYRDPDEELPFDVTCCDCAASIRTFGNLEEHNITSPNHVYHDPRHPDDFDYRIDYKGLMELVNVPSMNYEMNNRGSLGGSLIGAFNPLNNTISGIPFSEKQSKTATITDKQNDRGKDGAKLLSSKNRRQEMYKKEFKEIVKEFESTSGDIATERECLEKSLNKNSWVTAEDRNDVLAKYDSKNGKLISVESKIQEIKKAVNFT